MKKKLKLILVVGIFLNVLLFSRLAEAQEFPAELRSGEVTYQKLSGIGQHESIERQDPSNVLKIGERFFVWYTQRKKGTHPYASTIYYATSEDGLNWDDQGQALTKGPDGAWDSYGVITPYVAVANNKYYLFYTGTGDPIFRDDLTPRHIGIAVSNSPHGPWSKLETNPVLSPGLPGKGWDAVLVDDAHLIKRDDKYWLYYKGRALGKGAAESQWGLAFAENPEGPYEKYEHNPIVDSAHTVCVWPHREGVAAFVDITNTIQYAPDGIHFEVVKKLESVETGYGPYDPDAFTGTNYGKGINWGVAQFRNGLVHIVRFDCDLQVSQE